jgi:hypothetical protein
MKGLFDDWQAKGITSVLHEKKGGYANNTASIYGLAGKAEAEGVRIMTGVEVQGFEFGGNSSAVTALSPNKGRIGCDYVVVGVGPWVNQIWNMLELPRTVSIRSPDGTMHDGVRMWKYWCLEEGTLGIDPDLHKTNDGRMPPVCMSTPTRRYIPMSTARSSPTSCGACTTSPTSTSAASRAAPRPITSRPTRTMWRSTPMARLARFHRRR